MLRALVQNVVVPNTGSLADESKRLDGEVARFAADPQPASLHAVREQWKRALLIWKRAYAFRNGPIVETSAFLRATYWPAKPAGINAVLADSRPIIDSTVEEMGADLKGLFALEYLLFSEPSDEAAIQSFSGPPSDRRRQFARAVASNVAFYAEKVKALLGDGKIYSSAFAQGGRDSLSRLVGQMADTIENVAAVRLARIAGSAKHGLLRPSDVEGSASRTSQEIAVTYLTGTEAFYVGMNMGLTELVKATSPAIDERLRASFTKAIDAVKGLTGPIEQVAKSDFAVVEAAAASVKALEVGMKADLATALGVTLTFTSSDGD